MTKTDVGNENTKKSQDSNKKSIEEIYKQKDPIKHVLDCAGMYVGSLDADDIEMRILDSDKNMIVKKKINIVPAFFKIFDEILVNQFDQSYRSRECTKLKVSIDQEKGKISAWNNGSTIDVAMHKEAKVWVPELIFGHLRTSANYDQSGKLVGGKNGFGAKLTNIYSKKFVIELVDSTRHKKYTQVFEKNMSVINKPDIEDVSKDTESYFKVTYYPDFERFTMKNGMSDDVVSLLEKRVYDIAACAQRNYLKKSEKKEISVWLNGEQIKIKNFKDYIQMHYDHNVTIIYDDYIPRWKVGVVIDTDGKYEHVSYVNGICTYQGGTHVNYIMNQIAKKTVEHIKEKHKLTIKPEKVKEFFNIYIDSAIEDPDFNSQVKEKLTTRPEKFGSKYKVDNSFMEELYKTNYIQEIINYETYKLSKEVNKTDGKKGGSLFGIAGLQDADKAGTSKSENCTLIITEGNSARKYAVDGIEVVGSQYFGVWPIRGKFLNVGNATLKQLNENKEFINFKKILGLVSGEKYIDTKKLRYGHILILTDQDLDGSHIKGLIMSMFRNYWPELLQIDGFVQTLSTPIIKVFKYSDTRCQNPIETFYTLQDFNKWEKSLGVNANKKYNVKYYKGLATSSEKEAKELFKEFEQRVISYIWNKDKKSDSDDDDSEDSSEDEDSETDESSEESESDSDTDSETPRIRKVKKNLAIRKVDEKTTSSASYDALSMAFDADRVLDRKKWLRRYDSNDIIEYNKRKIPFSEFVNKDLIHFANYANVRMIPSVTDGLKIGQRKVLFGLFLKKPKQEIKVAQLAASVAENSAYKHGEVSLEETIVKQGQNYVGANNINLIYPSGNFGTRSGDEKNGPGSDHGASRYIYTNIEVITPYIFRDDDTTVLKSVVEEGHVVEPVSYAPIIPMVLVNGANGIGYGFSSTVPSYNPIEVTENLIRLIKGEELEKMIPYYFGYNGKIKEIKDNKKNNKNKKKKNCITYKMTGVYEILDEDTVLITEIPVLGHKAGIIKYIKFLEKKIITKDTKTDKDKKDKKKKKKNNEQYLVSVKNNCGNSTINIKVKFAGNVLQKLYTEGTEAIEKALGLSTTIKTSNFNLYDEFGRLTKYESVKQIYKDYYNFRLKIYKKRREHILKKLNNEMNIMKYKAKFIKEIVDETFVINKRKKEDIFKELKEKKYPVLHHDLDAIDPKDNKSDEILNIDDEQNVDKKKKISVKSYSYLTDMDLFSVTYEKMKKINENYEQKKAEYEYYENITEKKLWLKELKEFKEKYSEWIETRQKEMKKNDSIKYNKKGKVLKKN